MTRQIEINANKCDKQEKQTLKVAAYCRVSTDHEEQLSSLHNQAEYYKQLIRATLDWIDAGVFCDIGSGKNLKKRFGFQKLIQKCRRGKVDLIVTESISRFACNTLDALRTLQLLSTLGIDVWFESENIHLNDQKSSIFLTMFSVFAQAESESKSTNIKFGLRQSFRDPYGNKSHTPCYGYTHDAHGYLTVDQEKAATVQLIFMLCYLGYSLSAISDELQSKSIPAPRGGGKWSKETLRKMLSNEKYIGEVRLQKSYVEDFFSGQQVKNDGRLQQYYIEEHHDIQ